MRATLVRDSRGPAIVDTAISAALRPTFANCGKYGPPSTFPQRSAPYSFAFRNLSALLMTETELRLMAAAAKIGWSVQPVNG